MAKGKGVILVTGATGQQGGAVARELLARKHTVRAMTRKPDSDAAQALARQGAEVVKGDLNDVESLRRALQGAWGVFAVQNTWEAGVEGEEGQGKRIAELARKTGVAHYVYTSVGSAHRRTGIPHFDNKWRIEETVRGLGFPSYVILRPVFFMDNFLSPWFKPGLDQAKLMIGLKPNTVVQMIAVRDIGKYGLVAFEKAEELNRREIDLAGDAHTMPETAQILSKATGRSITFQPVPLEDVRKASEDYALMLEWFDRVGYDADISGNAKRYGIKPTTLAAWAAHARWS
jgi:uncharacterized protein YbjT (DUF2867 family)